MVCFRCRKISELFAQAIILIARAANGRETPFMGDSSKRPSEESRCLMLELTYTPLGLHLRKIGQFEINGPALADAIHTGLDGKSFPFVLCLWLKYLEGL